ncbi:MAG: hypothetical protein JSU73_12425 [candidate division WOR-3 bacterium]|nr:MAG: hypothetical protein JSU73_12425 [candidate division WOR-3 bacterium]
MGGALIIVLAVLAGLLFVLTAVGLTMSVMLLRRRTRTGPGAFIGGEKPEPDDRALDILRARRARPELTREQSCQRTGSVPFVQMKSDTE